MARVNAFSIDPGRHRTRYRPAPLATQRRIDAVDSLWLEDHPEWNPSPPEKRTYNRALLWEEATRVLAQNDLGTHVAPSPPIYPEQWLWDSGYSAIGLAHVDPNRASREVETVLAAQWPNGMVPHMILRGELRSLPVRTRLAWRIWQRRPPEVGISELRTSGFTQPPVLTDAAAIVGKKLGREERLAFYRRVVPRLVAFHEWFYRDRDINGDGLVVAVHPWETGMDNTPPWSAFLRRGIDIQFSESRSRMPWPRNAKNARLTRHPGDLDPRERISLSDGLMNTLLLLRLWRARFAPPRQLPLSMPLIEDVAINSIFIRNNALLCELAADASVALDDELVANMARSSRALALLWDEEQRLFFSRDARTKEQLQIPTAASLLPLYAGCAAAPAREALVTHLRADGLFAAPYPVPTVPLTSSYFVEERFWSGPVWLNVNWHLIDGLARAGERAVAEQLTAATTEMVSHGGLHEYFSALDGRGLGAPSFSWTAALTLDLLARSDVRSPS